MTDVNELRDAVDDLVDDERAESGDLLDAVDGGRGGARDVALAYLGLGEVEEARTWAGAAAADYLDYARFVAEGKLDPSDPPDSLGAKPWVDALTAMQLATLATDDEILAEAAEAVAEWASLPFLEECRGWETALNVDATAALAAFVLDGSYEQHVETARAKFDALDDPTIYAERDLNLASAVAGVANDDVARVEDACRELDAFHDALDAYESKPMELVNVHACFCVAFARQRGLDVAYESERVPGSIVDHY